jgi:alpha-D-ribose 1-methylphosphonate 5-triphosphate synthase subunit PhnH
VQKPFDTDYAQRVYEAALQAILEASKRPGAKEAVLQTREIFAVLLQLTAAAAAISLPDASTPAQIKHLSEDLAKEFDRHLILAKDAMDAHGGPPYPFFQ